MEIITKFWGFLKGQPRWQVFLFAPILASLVTYFLTSFLACVLTGMYWTRLALNGDKMIEVAIYAIPGIVGLFWRLKPPFIVTGVGFSLLLAYINLSGPTAWHVWVLSAVCGPGALAVAYFMLKPLPNLLDDWEHADFRAGRVVVRSGR
jgi:hypothetical protein